MAGAPPSPPSVLHRMRLRIYYEDTDFSGAVYHASYLRFLERGRTEWLRELGFDQRTAFEATTRIAFVVRRLSIDYLRPARMDDVVSIETGLREARGASLVLAQGVRREEERLVEAQVTVAALAAGRPVRLPARIREALAAAQAAGP